MSSPSNKLPEERPTNAYQRTAFFDGHLEIVGHAHREPVAQALVGGPQALREPAHVVAQEAQQARALGREPATVAEAREILEMPKVKIAA